MKIAIIGGGISGIAAARVLIKSGHQAVIFERGPSLGGVWAVAYPEVRLQNIAEHYRMSDVPWPFAADLHPTREQILKYLHSVVNNERIDLRPQHEVTALQESPNGWSVTYRHDGKDSTEHFDYALVAGGQYTGAPKKVQLADREKFTGQVITDRDVLDLKILNQKEIAVVGFGKSAVDMATFAAERGAQVHHVFRTPRWLLPKYIFGLHMSTLIFARMSSVMVPSWVQPTAAERFLHTKLSPLVKGFWSMIETIIRQESGLHGRHRDPEVRRRMRVLEPESSATFEMRSATALAPEKYYPMVVKGRIEPHRAEAVGLGPRSLKLSDGSEVPCDLVILSTGYESPSFPYLPAKYRALIEGEEDGMQLYRHLLHPRIPRLAFAGFNHGFLHVPSVEISMLWLSAHLRGDLALPPVDEMERRIEEIRSWKRQNTLFEPSRGCAISTRFHQYADVLLNDLGMNPYRKSNPLAELLSPYVASDYAGLVPEYERLRTTLQLPRRPQPLST